MFRVFFDSRQSVKEIQSFSPSPCKPALVVASWQELEVPMEIVGFEPATREQLKKVHDSRYVDDILDCKAENGFGNRSAHVAHALPWVAGSMIAGAIEAYRTKNPTFSPTSGAHHAGYSYGGAFCTFNTLVLAAVMAHEQGAKRIGIIDLDRHYGDGTDNIIERLGLDYIQHYSFGSQYIPNGKKAQAWLEELRDIVYQFEGCDLLILNAGVDAHVDDPLGGILTTEQIAVRDLYVYDVAAKLGIPVLTALAGGYQRTKSGGIDPVLRLHDATFLACDKVHHWSDNDQA